MKPVKSLLPIDRPRERLATLGPTSLSDQQLLAILLSSGTTEISVNRLAEKVLKAIDKVGPSPSPSDLTTIPGIGIAKASTIIASLEFARRRIRPEGIKIKQAQDIIPLVLHYASKKQEHFIVISLNGAHEVIVTRCITVGLLNCTQVHPREVFADVLTDRAAAVILAHNHPSGDLKPSQQDFKVTKSLTSAGELLGIRVLDHVILNGRGEFLSMMESGMMFVS